MKRFLADLHIHTALSPCADDEMTPPRIVETARGMGLHMIAVCDHNSARNAAAVVRCAGDSPAVLAGIEITTAEEAHVLGYFPDVAAAEAAGREVGETLPAARDNARLFGRQSILDESGAEIGCEARALYCAAGLSLSAVVSLIRRHGGLAVASHVDRPSNSVISQLGLFPTEAEFDAIEISGAGVEAGRQESYRELGLPMLTSSDSHFPGEIGAARTQLRMAFPTFVELCMALRGLQGRSCRILTTSDS